MWKEVYIQELEDNIIKMAILLKRTYRFNTISMKTPGAFIPP